MWLNMIFAVFFDFGLTNGLQKGNMLLVLAGRREGSHVGSCHGLFIGGANYRTSVSK